MCSSTIKEEKIINCKQIVNNVDINFILYDTFSIITNQIISTISET